MFRQKSKKKEVKKRFIFLWVAFILLIAGAFVYLPGFSRFHELDQEENKLDKQLGEIHTQIEALQEERNLLQNDLEYLEKVIREELGLVKPGEIIYKLVPEKKPTPQPVPPPAQKSS